jgi:dihydroxy-acid dehydratase
LDVPAGRLDLDVEPGELERRRAQWQPPPAAYNRGYGALFLAHVEQADSGCDFDFLRARGGEAPESEPLGLLEGWHGGW